MKCTALHKALVLGAILFALVPAAFAEEPADLTKPVSDVQVFRPEKRETKVELIGYGNTEQTI